MHGVVLEDIRHHAGQGAPRIVRLHGRGEVAQRGTARFDALAPAFDLNGPLTEVDHGIRAIIRIDLARIADSCGYGVPLLAYEGERPHSDLSTAKRLRVEGPDAMRTYEAKHNRVSIDGLPALS